MADSKSDAPKAYLEIDEIHRSDRRRWWWVTSGLMAIALVCALDAYAGRRRLPGIIKVDQDGRPTFFEDVDTPRRRLDNVQVHYFAERFVRMFVGVDGANADEHFGEILNGMTPKLRTTSISDGKLAKKYAAYRGENIKAVFDENALKVWIDKYNPTDQAASIAVTVVGHVAFPPKFGGVAAGQEVSAQFFLVRLEVVRVVPNKENPFGLEINWVEHNAFDTAEQRDSFVRSRGV